MSPVDRQGGEALIHCVGCNDERCEGIVDHDSAAPSSEGCGSTFRDAFGNGWVCSFAAGHEGEHGHDDTARNGGWVTWRDDKAAARSPSSSRKASDV